MEAAGVPIGRHRITVAPREYSVCSGCGGCEVVCSLTHDGFVSPLAARIFLDRGPTDTLMHTIRTCQHCEDHPCYYACPLQGSAMCVDENGIVYVDTDNCIGCGLCAKACRFDSSLISIYKDPATGKRKAAKCDLCRNRPEGPACVAHCQALCLGVANGYEPWTELQEEEVR